MEITDCVIIGAGPAGLSASLQASRQGLSVAVFEAARVGGQALAATLIENFPGFPSGIPGRELMASLRMQVESYGISIIHKRVVDVKRAGGVFVVSTDRGVTKARTVIVAVGLVPKKLGVPGECELLGRGVFAYPDPQTIDHRGRRVAVIGGGDAAFDLALGFSKEAGSVSILLRGEGPRCIPCLHQRAIGAQITVRPRVNVRSFKKTEGGISVAAGEQVVRADIVVICIGKEVGSDFIKLTKDDVPGIFFAGDCRLGHQQHIAMAIGDGIAAAMGAASPLTI